MCAKVRSLDPFLFLTIFIGNLSWDAEREDLTHLFSQYGEVSKCSLPLDRETGRKRGFAFVELSNEADEQSAIDDLQNVEWMGRAIAVRKAEPRRGASKQAQGGCAGDRSPAPEPLIHLTVQNRGRL